MKLNTAVLYDVENLTASHGKSDQEKFKNKIKNLSLQDILDKIQENNNVGDIAIQRAYTNWTYKNVSDLRDEIVKMGIDPIQMFGFGRGPTQNACDIQIVIDAMEIVFTNKVIEIFVIVSGDGGFASLAKKLREHGKTVIGCAYKGKVNNVWKAVSNDFIYIEEPKDKTEESKNNASKSSSIHTVENYRKTLKKPEYEIKFTQFSKEILHTIAEYLVNNRSRIQDVPFKDLIRSLDDTLEFNERDIRNTIMSFASANCFSETTRRCKSI